MTVMEKVYEPTTEIRNIFLHFFRLKVNGEFKDSSQGLTDEIYTQCVDAFHEIARSIELVLPAISANYEDGEEWYDDFMDEILPDFYDIIFNREY